MNQQLRGMAITLGIALGSVAAVLVAFRVALGSGAADAANKAGEAIWGKDGWTDALGSYLAPIFKPTKTEDEKAVILKTQKFQETIKQGKSIEQAFAAAGIVIGEKAAAFISSNEGQAQLVKDRLVVSARFNAENARRASHGLPPVPASARFKTFGFNVRTFEEAMAVRGLPLASFGTLLSRESADAALTQLRRLNVSELGAILGNNTMSNALTLRRLSLPTGTN